MKRAPIDLDCPAEQVTAEEISSDTYVAKGCGKKEIYNCKCSFGVGACTEYTCEKEAK